MVDFNEVASVEDSHSETREYTRINGKPAAGLIVVKQSGANTIATTQQVYQKLEQVHKLFPQLKFSLAYDQSSFITDSITDVERNALLGGTLAAVMLLFFLRNVRTTLVVATSIPISIISTFSLLYAFGFNLDTMSLGGLALATGLIVDDAVVVLENIYRHIERDHQRVFDAAINGTNEIFSAVMASTWTVMVVFMPLLLIRGQAGQMFTEFALVVIFSLAVSLLDATTVVPMLATRLIADTNTEAPPPRQNALHRAFDFFGRTFTRVETSYRRGLRWSMDHKWLTVGGAAAISAASLLLVPMIGTELMPVADSGDFNGTIKMPIGTSLATTNTMMRRIERMTLADSNVQSVFGASGTTLSLRGATTNLIPFQGSITVKLKDNRTKSTPEVIQDLQKKLSKLPSVRPLLTQTDLVTLILTGGTQNEEIDIFGADLNTLSRLANQVIGRVRGIPGLQNVDINWQEAMPEIDWQVDRRKANQLGVSFSDVANTIDTATNGTIASYYQESGFEYPIIVQLPVPIRKTVPQMQRLIVNHTSTVITSAVTPNITGSSATSIGGAPSAPPQVNPTPITQQDIELRQLAQPSYTMGPSEITRLNRQRYVAVLGTPVGRSAGQVQDDMAKAMVGMHFPAGYYWDWGLTQKRTAQEFSGLGLSVVLAIGLIYMLLASQFESFIHPLTILLSVPLAVTGVVLAMFLSGRNFGLTAFIGVLMLVGIVTKNGIRRWTIPTNCANEGRQSRKLFKPPAQPAFDRSL